MKFSEVVNGAEAIIDFLGPDKEAVPKYKSSYRARVCAEKNNPCPRNVTAAGWMYRVSKIAAKAASAYFEIKHKMELSVPNEDRLGICTACNCPLQLKVHMPIDYILSYTPEKTLAKFDKRCWVLKEMNECL